MTHLNYISLAGGLLCAAIGAGLFHLIGFPAAALTGSALGSSLYGLAGGQIKIPGLLRDPVFLVLGINIGAGVTPDMLRTALELPLSISVLALALIVGMVASRAVLQHYFGFDRACATLASAPGHLSYVISLAAETKTDITIIASIQSIRVLFLTLCVPPFISWTFGASGLSYMPENLATVPGVAGLIVVGCIVAVVFQRWSFPAAWLLAGMVVSAMGHGFELTPGRWPDPVVTAAFIVMGTLIGSRFSGANITNLRRVILAGLSVTALTFGAAIAGAFVVILIMHQSPALMIAAFAPGGVEAMAAIAVTLGLDPAVVAAHHIVRLILLSFIIPSMLPKGTLR